MSWPQWPGAAGVPQPGVVQAPLINPAPNVLNPAATMMPTGQYTPEQWAQMQQQNWQQWAQWQQQFQQWQQQYGAEYQKSITALAAQARPTPVQPPVPFFNVNTNAPPPLPVETKPPPPPDDPQLMPPLNMAHYPSFTSAPPPIPQSNFNTAPPPQPPPPKDHYHNQFNANQGNPPPIQGGFPNRNMNEGGGQQRFGTNQNYPNNNRGGPNRNPNWQNQNNRNQQNFNDIRFNPSSNPANDTRNRGDFGGKRPFNQPNEGGDPKRNKLEAPADVNKWQGNQQKTKWEAPASQPDNQRWNTKPPPETAPKHNPEELTEAEKKFDKQFADWEAQFQKWKEQNANHPDKEQYREYEKKWEAWRSQLLDRREQMRRKRLGLSGESPQPTTTDKSKPEVEQEKPADSSPVITTPSQTAPQPFQKPSLLGPGPQAHPKPGLLGFSPAGFNPDQFGNKANASTPSIPPLMNRLPPTLNDQPLVFKKEEPGNELTVAAQSDGGEGFLKSASAGGIPGLDLVKDGIKEEQKVEEQPENEKRPDLEAISKGINSILGDQKLMNMLSMVSQTQYRPPVSNPINTIAPIKLDSPKFSPEPPQEDYSNQENPDFYENPNDEFSNVDEQTRSSFHIRNDPEDLEFDIFEKPEEFSGGNIDFNQGPGPFNRGPNNFNTEPIHWNKPGDNFNRGPDNFNKGPDNFNRPPDNFNRGPDNFNRGPNNFNRGPDNFNRGPNNFNRGPDNVNRGPDNFNRGADNFRGPDNFNKGPDNFNRGPDNFNRGPPGDFRAPGNFNRGPNNFNRGPGNFNKGPDNFNRGPDNFNKGPDNFNRGPDNFNRGPENFNRGPDNFNRGPDGFRGSDNFKRGSDTSDKFGDNFNKGPNFNRESENYEEDPEEFNRGPGNFNRGPNNFNRSSENFNRFNRGPNTFDRGLNAGENFDRDNRGPKGADNFTRGGDEGFQNFNMRPPGGARDFENNRFGQKPDTFNKEHSFDEESNSFDREQDDCSRSSQNVDKGNFNNLETPIFEPPPNVEWNRSNSLPNEQIPPQQELNEKVIPPLQDEGIWKPDVVIDYDHKPLKPVEPDVIVEPVYTFDYRHKPLNRIPYPQRPKWLSNMLKNYPEFDVTIARPFDQQLRRYPTNERFDSRASDGYQKFEDRNRRFFDDRERKPFNDRVSFDDRDRKPFEHRKPYGDWDRKNEDRNQKRSDDWERKPYDNSSRKPFEERKSRDFDDRRMSDNKKPYSKDVENYKSIENENESLPVKDKVQRKEKDIGGESYNIKTAPMVPSKSNVTLIEDLLSPPGRYNRPPRIVIILRGPPGSGKSFLAKLIKDKEVENGGSAPRILCLDDYFMVEQEKEVEEDGRKVKVKEMVYEFEECMEASYRTSLMKSFKKTVTDGYFNFIIVDNINDKVKYFGEMWSFAKQNGFQVYICQMELDVQTCTKRNIHGRSEVEIERCVASWEPTPAHHPVLDGTGLIQSGSISEVEMEEINSPPSENMNEEEHLISSKWDSFDYSVDNLAKLDGTNKPLRTSRTMEDYLQLDDDWVQPVSSKPGQKRVRWADLEERKEQEKMRAIGFVVGQTNWDRMMDPTMGSGALTQTKYIERYS